MSTRPPRTFYEAVDGLMVRKVKDDEHKHLTTCGRGLWLNESMGAYCTDRCRLIRAWLDANEVPAQGRLLEVV